MMTPATEVLVDLGPATLNVRDEGSGRPVVLMHGWSYDLHLWDELVPDLLAAGLRTVRYDQRGHGNSPSTGPYRFDALVDDLGLLIDRLGLRQPILCGLSLGGFVAMEFAATRPEAVAGLVLADTCPHAIEQDTRMARTIPGSAAGTAALGRWWDADHPLPPGADPAAHARRRERFLRNDADGLREAIAACAKRPPVAGQLPRITAPTQVICGEHDLFFPPSLHADLAGAIPGAELTVIAGAGHISCLDRPAEFNQAVHRFLGRAGLLARPEETAGRHQRNGE